MYKDEELEQILLRNRRLEEQNDLLEEQNRILKQQNEVLLGRLGALEKSIYGHDYNYESTGESVDQTTIVKSKARR